MWQAGGGGKGTAWYSVYSVVSLGVNLLLLVKTNRTRERKGGGTWRVSVPAGEAQATNQFRERGKQRRAQDGDRSNGASSGTAMSWGMGTGLREQPAACGLNL